MWKTYSLRTRLCLFLCGVFLTALITGLILLRFFAADQLVDENEPAARSGVLIAGALNNALKASPAPAVILDAFAAGLNSSNPDAIRFRRIDAPELRIPRPLQAAPGRLKVPDWFVDFLSLPDLSRHVPILIDGQRVGDLVYEPDVTADVFEKWIGFLSIFASGVGLALLTVLIAFWTVGAALKPLRDLAGGLARLRAGEYGQKVTCSGPPEIRQSCIAVNELASTLSDLNSENRSLLRRMVSVQDEERRDISRELHDELGPLLFAIRANAIAMADSAGSAPDASNPAAERVMQSVEALQIANRRILDRLRPLYIKELGLRSSVEKLLRDVRVQRPDLDVGFEIDPDLITVDSVVTQTVYRVLQEGITNVLKHADATEIRINATLRGGSVHVEVSDNGIGWAIEPTDGRGLTGMRERLRALAGTFELSRRDGWTSIRCSLPATGSTSC